MRIMTFIPLLHSAEQAYAQTRPHTMPDFVCWRCYAYFRVLHPKKGWNSEGNKSFYSQKNSFHTLHEVTFFPPYVTRS